MNPEEKLSEWAGDLRDMIEEAEQFGAVFYFNSECSVSCCMSLRLRLGSVPNEEDPVLWSNERDY